MRLLRKITAVMLAVSMVLPSMMGMAVQVYAADTGTEVPVITEYLSDNLTDTEANKAAKKSEEYWKAEAPADVQEAAQMYAEDATDGEMKADTNGAGEVSLDDMQLTTAEKKYDENGLRETAHNVRVTYTIANKKYLKAKTIDDLFKNNVDAFLTSVVSISPVYESRDYNDCYVAFLNYGGMNGLSEKIIDADFVTNVQESPKDVESDIVFDKKTGIVYIPKSYYFAADGTELGYDLQAQVLVAPKLGNTVDVNVAVENHSAAKSVLRDGVAEFTVFKGKR